MFKILLVDDSVLVRRIVADMLQDIPDVVIIGEASNGKEAIGRIILDRPDLVIMDVEMPVLDGLSTLEELRARGIAVPVIMLSVLTQHGAQATFKALELGALDFVPKPSPKSGLRLTDIEGILTAKVRDMVSHARDKSVAFVDSYRRDAALKKGRRYELLLIGASTGGPQALHKVFRDMPEGFPLPILVVQHMPPVFTAAFADRLDRISAVRVSEAKENDALVPGHAFVAPGNRHMVLEGRPGSLHINLNDDPPSHAHRPSIDVTLGSVVDKVGGHAMALIMTGMGRDGADNMKRLHDAGGLTFAQDEASSVVFGMNRKAIELGAIDRIVALDEALSTIQTYL